MEKMPKSKFWSDKELIDASPELLDEKDRQRQIKLQDKRAKKLAKEEAKRAKKRGSDSKRLFKKHRSGDDCFSAEFGKEDI